MSYTKDLDEKLTVRLNAQQSTFLKEHAARLSASGCRTTRVQLVRAAVDDMMMRLVEQGGKDDNQAD